MKRKNNFLYVLIFFVVVLIIGVIIWYKLATRKTYTLGVPNSYDLSSISYELPTGIETVADEEKMNIVLNGLDKLNLKTKTVSVEDIPTNVDDLVSIRLNFKEDDVDSFYLYSLNGKYYIEEPYNGIYKLSKKQYDYIITLIK